MTNVITQQILDNATRFQITPALVQQPSLNVLEAALGTSLDVVDATSPFIFLLEANASAVAAGIAASESVVRRLYPKLAATSEEISHHISDEEFIGIFATGAVGEIKIALPFLQVLQAAVSLNNSTVKTVTIPRDTLITVNEVSLGIAYPININLMDFDVVQVLYDNSLESPLYPLVSNVLTHDLINIGGVTYLQISVPVVQYTNSTTIFTLSETASFSQQIPFSDSFYYARAFINQGGSSWIEINTTHSPLVYDVSQPTLLLKVIDNTLQVSLPDIYQSLNLASTSIRVDVYSTRGAMEVDLSQIPSSNFLATWKDFDTFHVNAAAQALNNINDIRIYSTQVLTGGSNASTLETMRQRVIYHVNAGKVPVRNSDIVVGLQGRGYRVQKLIDSVTDRVFLATKNLPDRLINGLTITPLMSNTQVVFDLAGGYPGGNQRRSIVTQIVDRATIKPEAIYQISGGNVRLLTDIELTALEALVGQGLCDVLNAGTYLYSPFYYVIDYTQEVLAARPYDLARPVVVSRTFVESNTQRNYNIVTTNATMALIDNQFILELTTTIPNGITGVICQLSYYDKNSNTTVYRNATAEVLSEVATFTFTLETNFDINQLDQIELTNMINTLDHVAPIFVGIADSFHVFYLVEGDNAGLETAFDDQFFQLADMPAVIGATHETITLRFGQSLHNLYCYATDILSIGEYITYPETVYATYEARVYQRLNGDYLFTTNEDGSVDFVVEHEIGDPVLDGEGNPVVAHAAGDLVLDANGKAIPIDPSANGVKRKIGITMVDAKYRFATALATAEYTRAIPKTIVGYLQNEIDPMDGKLNERTELYYAPQGEPSVLMVNIGNRTEVQVPSVLNIQVTYYMTKEGMRNETVQANLKTVTRQIISKHLQNVTISEEDFIADLNAVKSHDVISFKVNSFLPNGYPMVTLVDETKNFVVGEELVLLADGSLEVKDTVRILFNSAS